MPAITSVERLRPIVAYGRRLAQFQVGFNMPVSGALAGNAGSYQVIQPRRSGKSAPQGVLVRSVHYNASNNAVVLWLGKFHRGRPLVLTIPGLVGAETPVATIVMPL
jgi:hypothetical protein